MAFFSLPSLRLRADPAEQQRHLLALLFGALFGALWAKLAPVPLSENLLASMRHVTPLRSWLRGTVFSGLLSVALLLRSKAPVRLLFFGKGALTALILCVFAASGGDCLRVVLSTLLFEDLLPLPFLLLVAAEPMEENPTGWKLLGRLFFLFLVQLLGVLLKTILFP